MQYGAVAYASVPLAGAAPTVAVIEFVEYPQVGVVLEGQALVTEVPVGTRTSQ
jgi:hypothetical protein